jgi:hypothetical protein
LEGWRCSIPLKLRHLGFLHMASSPVWRRGMLVGRRGTIAGNDTARNNVTGGRADSTGVQPEGSPADPNVVGP